MNDRVRSTPVPSKLVKTNSKWLPTKDKHPIVLCMKFDEYISDDH